MTLGTHDIPLLRLQLDPPLPCGMPHCGNLAHSALAELDPRSPGLWQVLPQCEACAAAAAITAKRVVATEESKESGDLTRCQVPRPGRPPRG